MMKQLRGIDLKRFLKRTPKHNKDIVLILENIQYARNVAAMFRTADAVKVSKIVLTGISQQPPFGKDLRKASRNKEKSVQWEYVETTGKAVQKLKRQGYKIIALELTDKSEDFTNYSFKDEKIGIVLGNEVYGVTQNTLDKVDSAVYIPMFGKGASLNVTTSAAILLYKVIEWS